MEKKKHIITVLILSILLSVIPARSAAAGSASIEKSFHGIAGTISGELEVSGDSFTASVTTDATFGVYVTEADIQLYDDKGILLGKWLFVTSGTSEKNGIFTTTRLDTQEYEYWFYGSTPVYLSGCKADCSLGEINVDGQASLLTYSIKFNTDVKSEDISDYTVALNIGGDVGGSASLQSTNDPEPDVSYVVTLPMSVELSASVMDGGYMEADVGATAVFNYIEDGKSLTVSLAGDSITDGERDVGLLIGEGASLSASGHPYTGSDYSERLVITVGCYPQEEGEYSGTVTATVSYK